MSITPVFAEERQNKILSLLKVKNKLLVNDLCKEFNVSPATIRNDLNQLEKSGLLKRTHGGTMLCMKIMTEPTLSQKNNSNSEQKQRIAEYAAQFVENGDTIAIDTGTTTYSFAQLLSNKHNLTVITTDIHIATLLEDFLGVSVVLAGGKLRKGFSCTTGAITNSLLASFNVDKLFLATNAVSPSGSLCTPDIEQAQVKKSLIKMGKEVFLLCDSSKFDRQSFVEFGTLDEVDNIITDSNLSPEIFNRLQSKNISIATV